MIGWSHGDNGFSIDILNAVFFRWSYGLYVLIDLYAPKNTYSLAYNCKAWRESDIHIKATPPWREVERPKRFEFSRRPAVLTF